MRLYPATRCTRRGALAVRIAHADHTTGIISISRRPIRIRNPSASQRLADGAVFSA